MSTVQYLPLAGPVMTAIVAVILKRRIQQVHVLVNDRMSVVMTQLTNALADNVRLKDEAGETPGPPVEVPIFTVTSPTFETKVIGVLTEENNAPATEVREEAP